MSRRTLLAFALLASISIVSGACSASSGASATASQAATSSAAQDSKGVVYYLSPSQSDEWQVFASNMIQDHLTEAGYEAKLLSAGSEDSTLQLNQLDTAIAQRPQAIIIQAVDPVAIVSGVDKARDAGIPVVTFERIISDTTVDFGSVTNNFVSGASGGKAVLDFLTEKYGTPKGRVLSIMGAAGDPGSVNMEAGFRSVMDPVSEVIVETKTAGQWDATVAASVADDYLTVHPDTDFIYAGGGFLASAIVPILETHDKAPGEVGLSGWGGMPVELQNIRDGWFTMTIDQPLIAETAGTVLFLDDVIAGRDIAEGPITVEGWPANVVMKDHGPELQIDAETINKDTVDDPKWWANQVTE